jgi:hypothetical protein
LAKEEQDYDKEKYREMLLEVAETVRGYFDFDRMLYGDTLAKMNPYTKYYTIAGNWIFESCIGRGIAALEPVNSDLSR